MKKRTVLGILCLILALLLAFGLTPIMNKLSDGRVSVVRMKQDVSQGHKMTEDDIEIVSVGAVNLPSGVIKDKEAVLGKYASSDLWKGDCLFPAKLSDTADSASDVFRSLDGTQVAVYTPDGKQAGSAVCRNGAALVGTNIQPGNTAIVKIGEKSVKVIVK